MAHLMVMGALHAFNSVQQILLSELECPVCMEYMKPPITLCVNGHNICNTCKQKIPHCPTCEQQFLNTRNVALEKVAIELNYPCVYRKYGCSETYKLDFIGKHQDRCQYIPQPCPVNKLNLGTCTWTGISSSIMSHLNHKHKNLLYYYGNNSDCPFAISGFTPATKHCQLILAYNAVFCTRSEIKNGIFYSVLQYIGPAADAVKYRYKLKFVNKERAESLAVCIRARSLDEDLGEVHNSGNCVKLYPEQYNRFANEGSELAFRLDIFGVGSDDDDDDFA